MFEVMAMSCENSKVTLNAIFIYTCTPIGK